MREVILVQHCSDVAGRFLRKRISVKQREDIWRTFKEADEEIEEPFVLPIGTERGKPHLPIEPRLMRRDETWAIVNIAGLPAEGIGPPDLSFVAAFDDDLIPFRGHHAKKPVGIETAERPEKALEGERPLESQDGNCRALASR